MADDPKPVRLQKYIAAAGFSSRRGAEELIAEGRVTVNGEQVTQFGRKILPGVDIVLVDGRPAHPEERRLYRFHKPPGIITTLSDEQGRRSIADFVSELPVRVFPVGRLDTDVVGLLLLTNDGELAEQLLHPRYEVDRTYHAYLRGRSTGDFVQMVTGGLMLEGSAAIRAKSARVLTPSAALKWLLGPCPADCFPAEIVVAEGAKHLVKKLCAAAGYPVFRLGRVAFGPYRLGRLPRGRLEEIAVSDN